MMKRFTATLIATLFALAMLAPALAFSLSGSLTYDEDTHCFTITGQLSDPEREGSYSSSSCADTD